MCSSKIDFVLLLYELFKMNKLYKSMFNYDNEQYLNHILWSLIILSLFY